MIYFPIVFPKVVPTVVNDIKDMCTDYIPIESCCALFVILDCCMGGLVRC